MPNNGEMAGKIGFVPEIRVNNENEWLVAFTMDDRASIPENVTKTMFDMRPARGSGNLLQHA